MQRPFDHNNDNSQWASAAPSDDRCSCARDGLDSRRPCPVHYPQDYSHLTPQWSTLASLPVLSVQTNGLLQSQSFSPTSSMTSPSPSSAWSPPTAPGYGAQINYGSNLVYAQGEPYAPQSPSWPSVPTTSPSGSVPFTYTVPGYGAQATTADYSHNYNSPMSPSALGTTASWYTDSNNTYPSHSVNTSPTPSSPSTSRFPTQAHRPKRRKDPTYFCQEDGCGKGFTAKHNLGYHTRGFHKGERPYLCGKCHKTFINLNDLKRHEKKCTTYP